MPGKTIDMMKLGDSDFFEKTVSEADVYAFAGITGDMNPAHVNAEWASQNRFGQRIAHGMLAAGFVSAVLGTRLPGEGSIYLGQELRFTAPVYFDDTIRATVTVIELKPEKNIVRLSTVCTNQKGKIVLEGTATLMPPKA